MLYARLRACECICVLSFSSFHYVVITFGISYERKHCQKIHFAGVNMHLVNCTINFKLLFFTQFYSIFSTVFDERSSNTN